MTSLDLPRLAPAIRPYDRRWLRNDIVAGLATGAVIIPQAMAYATVAGMPVQYGLYTCMVPLAVYAFIGGSRRGSVTTTSTIATLTASTMVGAGIAAGSPDAPANLVTLTLLVGLILLVARLLRLGSVVENINETTLIGIKIGVGLTVAAAQLPQLLGLPDKPAETGFFRILWWAGGQFAHANVATAALAIGSIAVLVALGKFAPRVPGPLVVVAVGIGLAAFAGLTDHGVALIPEVPQGVPVPALPALDHIGGLLPGALAIAMMAFLETVAVARSMRRVDEPQIDPDREVAATGFAALIGAFFHALPPAGGFSQTGVNARAGARTQVSGLVTAALAVLVALFLAPVLSLLPQATLAAMVLVAVLGLIDVTGMRRLYHFDRLEFWLAAAVAAVALTAGLLPAVGFGVLTTIYLVLRELNQPHIVQVVSAPDGTWTDGEVNTATPADPLVLRFDIGLYAANLHANGAVVRQLATSVQPRPATVVLDLSRLPRVTSTILNGLRDLESELVGDGFEVRYAALHGPVRDTARRWPWWHEMESQGRYFDTVEAAVAR